MSTKNTSDLTDVVEGSPLLPPGPEVLAHWNNVAPLSPERVVEFMGQRLRESGMMRNLLTQAGYEIAEPTQLSML